MIKLRVDDEAAIPLSVDSSSAVSMTVSEAFIDRGGSAIQNNKNATPSTSQVVVTPDQGFDAMAKVTVAAMPQGEIDPASLSYDTYLLRGRITAEANVTQAGYVPIGGNVARAYCDELLPSENPKTVTPTTSEQTAVDANKWTKGQIKVGPIPPEYIIPTGTKSIAANGTGIDVKAYEKVDVAVPGITPSGTLAIATNGSHDVTNYATASVAVPASAVDSGTKNINSNGTHNVVGYASANVNVPNSYSASDEGKVVSNGALVSQSSATYTENGTYDTTTKNEVVVNVQGGGGGGGTVIASGTVAGNGGYGISVPVGTKMPETDFAFVIHLPKNQEITYVDDSNNQILLWIEYVVLKKTQRFDLSSVANNIKSTNTLGATVNNDGTIKNLNPNGTAAIRVSSRANGYTFGMSGNETTQTISRTATGFKVNVSSAAWMMVFRTGYTYEWEIIYFGDDPTNDIVEIS